MRSDSLELEERRLSGVTLDNYPWVHERHRIFPEVFQRRCYTRILDIAAGIGIVAARIQASYPCFMICNDICKESLRNLRDNHHHTISFDLDDPQACFPFPDETFDAVISLATLEHIIHLRHHLREIRRILRPGGDLFLSTPNYAGIHFVLPYLLKGKSFHDPMREGIERYEFYAHVRYFTLKTLMEYVSSFGFRPARVYLPLPKESSRFLALKKKSRLLAFSFRSAMYLFCKVMTPRWAFHPVLCFSKDLSPSANPGKPAKILL